MIEEDILPGFASAMSVIALFNPKEKIKSGFNNFKNSINNPFKKN